MRLAEVISSTVGRVSPKYRTLSQWIDTYDRIIEAKPISHKTKANRRSSLRHIHRRMGGATISAIKPHEVAEMVLDIHGEHPPLAKRVLIESRDMFGEAVNYGWLERNPAASVKMPVVHVTRKRLSFEHWCRIAEYSEQHMPAWVSRMLMLALVTGQRRSDLARMKFSDVWDDHLHVEQEKTGARLALPLALQLEALGLTLGQVIDDCRGYYGTPSDFLLRKKSGKPLVLASLSARFEEAREGAYPGMTEDAPSLHECRSLSERLYREQGIDTMTLLGHKHQAMTDLYNDDRGLSRGKWKTLTL